MNVPCNLWLLLFISRHLHLLRVLAVVSSSGRASPQDTNAIQARRPTPLSVHLQAAAVSRRWASSGTAPLFPPSTSSSVFSNQGMGLLPASLSPVRVCARTPLLSRSSRCSSPPSSTANSSRTSCSPHHSRASSRYLAPCSSLSSSPRSTTFPASFGQLFSVRGCRQRRRQALLRCRRPRSPARHGRLPRQLL
jgi:hypothetical protein